MMRIGMVGVVLAAWVAAGLTAAGEQKSAQEQIAASLAAWQKAKVECKGSYSYAVLFTSFVGFGHETVIVVRDNNVAERRYRAWSGQLKAPRPGEPPKPQGESWTETGKALGTHKKGAPLKTLDELYAEAGKIAAKELQPHERRYLRLDKAGLLNSCFIVDTPIMDDAPKRGVSIQNIRLERPREKK